MAKKQFLEAIATLTGMVIGAGVLGIPYVVAKAGFFTGLVNIIFIGLAILLINLFMGEIILRTKKKHQLPGYAEKYLKKKGKIVMIFSMLFGLYGAMIAYTIKEGEFLHAVFSFFFGGSPIVYSAIFFAIMAFLIYKGFDVIEDSELVLMSFVIFVVLLVFVLSFSSIKINNLTSFNASNLFIPYGVVLFAYLGLSSIPEMRKEMKNKLGDFKKAIITGSLISVFVYIIFALAVVGVTGLETTDGAILGLVSALGLKMLFVGTIFGILTMATSFLACGLVLRDMYHEDIMLNYKLSFWITITVPIIFVGLITLFRVKNAFFKVIDITGTLEGGLIGMLVVLMFWKAKTLGDRNPEYSIKRRTWLGYLLIVMFLFGIIYKMLEIFGFMSL